MRTQNKISKKYLPIVIGGKFTGTSTRCEPGAQLQYSTVVTFNTLLLQELSFPSEYSLFFSRAAAASGFALSCLPAKERRAAVLAALAVLGSWIGSTVQSWLQGKDS